MSESEGQPSLYPFQALILLFGVTTLQAANTNDSNNKAAGRYFFMVFFKNKSNGLL
jgi:hypothetical protein